MAPSKIHLLGACFVDCTRFHRKFDFSGFLIFGGGCFFMFFGQCGGCLIHLSKDVILMLHFILARNRLSFQVCVFLEQL